MKSAGHSPSSGSVKTRFKAIFKNDILGFAGAVFMFFLFAPGGRLNYEAYNVEQFTNM